VHYAILYAQWLTGSLSQEWKNLGEGSPLAIVRGHYRTVRKKG